MGATIEAFLYGFFITLALVLVSPLSPLVQVSETRGFTAVHVAVDSLQEDDPRWQCATMGNLICG